MTKAYIAAYALGALLVLGLAPFNYVICCFISFSLFITLLERYKTPKQSFYLGLCFGFGYFNFGLYWLYYAFLVLYNNELNFWLFCSLAILCLVIFFIFLSLYWALATLACNYISTNIYNRIIALSLFLGLAEYLRGHLFTGFPWNLIGYSLTFNLLFMQISALLNLYLLNILACLIFCSPAIFFFHRLNKLNICFISIIICFLIFDISYGYFRLTKNATINKTAPSYIINLIQPNISQKQKLNEKYILPNFLKLIALIKQKNTPKVNLIICPETSIDFLLNYNPIAKKYIKEALFPNQLLLLGAPRLGSNNKIYNSALLLNSEGDIINFSDKLHLVPFGEYLPFKTLLPNINFTSNFEAGKTRHTIELNKDLCYLPLICYEAIFPDELQYVGAKPNLLINITNDAWYGTSIGPFQHFRQARMRAIEEHIPLIRVGNNGISAIIDSYGRIIKKINLNKTDVLNTSTTEFMR